MNHVSRETVLSAIILVLLWLEFQFPRSASPPPFESFLRSTPRNDRGGNAGPTGASFHVGDDVVGGMSVLGPGGSRLPHTKSRPERRLSPFSSYECSGGSQRFDRIALKRVPQLPPLDDPGYHFCLLRDVCLMGGVVTYYTDAALDAAVPQEASSKDGFPALYAGFRDQDIKAPLWRPNFLPGPRPQSLAFAPEDRVYVLDQLSYVENFGHLLVDNLLAAYSAAEVIGADVGDVQLLGIASCANTWDRGNVVASVPVEVLCERNVAAWNDALFSYPYLQPPHTTDMCFRELVVGAAPAFALWSVYLHRSSSVRLARAHVHSRLGVSPSIPLSGHTVLVLNKRLQYAAIEYAGLCTDVNIWALRITPPPYVVCVTPAHMTIVEQLRVQANATVLLAEVGSTGYGSLFARPGSSFISVVPSKGGNAKESQVFLFNTDVQVRVG